MQLPFPVRGIDRSKTAAELVMDSPVLATVNARNVRNRPTVAARRGGGKRGGLVKAVSALAGTASGRRITAIAVNPSAQETVQWRQVYTNFRGLITGDNTRAPSLGTDLALFAQDGTTGNVENNYDVQINNTDLSGTLNATYWPTPGPRVYGGLVFDWYPAGSGNLKYPGLAVMGVTDNDMTARFFAAGTASAGSGGEGAIGEPHGIGPFVRGSGDLSQCFCACLLRSGANQVQLAIRKINGATRTTVAVSASFTLDAQGWGSTSPYNPRQDTFEAGGSGISSSDGNFFAPLQIRIYANSSTITAELYWKRQGPGSSTTPAITLTYASTDYNTYTRAGVIAGFSATSGATVANRWYLQSVYCRVQVRPAAKVVASLDRTATETPTPERYYMPAAWTACRLTTAGSLTSFTGTSQTAAPSTPAVDTLPVAIVANPVANASHFIVPTTTPSSRYAVEVRGRQAGLTGYDSDTTEDVLGAAFRVSADKLSGILIEVRHGFKFTSLAYQRTRQDCLETIRFVAVVNGARTVLETYTKSNLSIPPFKSDVWMRWRDKGAEGSGGVFEWSMNGQVIATFDITTMSGWNAGTMSGLLTATNSVGAAFYGNTAAPEFTYAAGFRLVDTSGEESALLAVGRVRTDIAVITNSGFVDLGRLGQDSWARASGGIASVNRVPSIAWCNGKWYMVDGAANKVIDPVGQSVYDMIPTAGTLPGGMRLIAPYRGALLMASSLEQPSFWALSRRGVSDPLDFDYGADPVPTAAIPGSDPDVGEPPDPIIALIPFGSEMMLFGSHRNFFFLERDPGYGGRMDTFTRATGIVGPRAWCYGATANEGTLGELLYFVGNGELWRMVPGGRPVNVSHGRVPGLDVDGSTILVQLEYDETDDTVNVYLTPTDGTTVGTHIVYDVKNNGFFEDQYPLAHGPWAVGRGYSTDATYKRPLLGGNDGYIRMQSANAADDDGSGIDSYVDIMVPWMGGLLAESMVEEMSAGFLESSQALNWYWFTAETPENVAAREIGEQVNSGTWAPTRLLSGATVPVSIRRTADAHKLRIRQNGTEGRWSMEYLSVLMNIQGRRRIV